MPGLERGVRVARRKGDQRRRDVSLHQRGAVAAEGAKDGVLDGDALLACDLFQPRRQPVILVNERILVDEHRSAA
jgi:hypothetical protein